MSPTNVQQMADRIGELLSARLGVHGPDLRSRVRAARRQLPRRVRRQAEYLASAAAHGANPRWGGQIDDARVAQAYDSCLRYLKPLGAWGRFRRRLMHLTATLAFVMLVAFGVSVYVAVQQGIV